MSDFTMLKTINISMNSLVTTICWVAFFSFVLPLISTFIIFISGIASLILNDVSSIEQLELNLLFISVTAIISAILLLPFLKYSLYTNDSSTVASRLGLKSISIVPLIVTVLIVLTYSVFESFIFKIYPIETPNFMINIEAQADTLLKTIMLFLVVGIIGPIVEEVIFRGVIFYRLKQSLFGVSGTIIISSIGFTIIHMQYEQTEIYILLFIFSCLLGVIRHLTGNLYYCIVGHMIINLLTLTSLNL